MIPIKTNVRLYLPDILQNTKPVLDKLSTWNTYIHKTYLSVVEVQLEITLVSHAVSHPVKSQSVSHLVETFNLTGHIRTLLL